MRAWATLQLDCKQRFYAYFAFIFGQILALLLSLLFWLVVRLFFSLVLCSWLDVLCRFTLLLVCLPSFSAKTACSTTHTSAPVAFGASLA